MKKVSAMVLLAGAMGVTSTAAAAQTVAIDSGKLHGSTANGVDSYKGVPYAAPPVGALRWRDPQPAKPWTGVREATAYGTDCEQASGRANATDANHSEDCLFVNVWAPKATAKLPVMVWIHGGGFVLGGTNGARFDGTKYAQQGVVLVSLNYRLGRLGFFAHPALRNEAPQDVQGNYGLMDQIAALKWVQRNIAAFGGDPKTVTIFGESAGGLSVQMLMVSPLTTGLFERAIVESGAGRPNANPSLGEVNLKKGEEIGTAFAKSAGIEGVDAEALVKLRALPVDALCANLDMAHINAGEVPLYSGPIIDGQAIVANPTDIYAHGGGARIALMIGATDDDAGKPQTATKAAEFATFGKFAAQAQAAYDPAGTASDREVLRQIASDRQMAEPARYAAMMYAARGLPAYEYRFSYVPEADRATVHGAKHASELAYVFGNVGGARKPATASDEALAKAMVGYWSAFAKTGDPNEAGLPVWPKYSAKADMLMEFGNAGEKAEADPWKARLDAMQAAAK